MIFNFRANPAYTSAFSAFHIDKLERQTQI